MTSKYEAALATVRAAQERFNIVRDAYRARKIGDAEFLAAREEMTKANAAFDIAFAEEANN